MIDLIDGATTQKEARRKGDQATRKRGRGIKSSERYSISGGKPKSVRNDKRIATPFQRGGHEAGLSLR